MGQWDPREVWASLRLKSRGCYHGLEAAVSNLKNLNKVQDPKDDGCTSWQLDDGCFSAMVCIWKVNLQIVQMSGDIVLNIQVAPATRIGTLLTMVEAKLCKPCILFFEGSRLDWKSTVAQCGLKSEAGFLQVLTAVVCSSQAQEPMDFVDTARTLRDGGYTAMDCKMQGITAQDCKDAGFTALDCKDGYTACQLRDAGYTALQLYIAGFTARELIDTGYTLQDTARQFRDAFTARELWNTGFPALELIDIAWKRCTAALHC